MTTFWVLLVGGLFCGFLGIVSYVFWEDDDDDRFE